MCFLDLEQLSLNLYKQILLAAQLLQMTVHA
jgi:hypothetical protein